MSFVLCTITLALHRGSFLDMLWYSSFLCNSLIFSLFLKTKEDDSSSYANKRIWGHSPLQSCCRENEGDTSRRSGRWKSELLRVVDSSSVLNSTRKDALFGMTTGKVGGSKFVGVERRLSLTRRGRWDSIEQSSCTLDGCQTHDGTYCVYVSLIGAKCSCCNCMFHQVVLDLGSIRNVRISDI